MSSAVTYGQWTWVGIIFIVCVCSLILNFILGLIILKQKVTQSISDDLDKRWDS